MIDWPNVLVGFALGVAATLAFWIVDRARGGRQRRAETWESWKVAMSDLEFLMWKPETRSSDIFVARSRYPIDLWRAILTDREGFRLLERVEGAYSSVEYFAAQRVADPSPEKIERFARAESEWSDARTAFVNYSRSAKSAGYTKLVEREERQQLRRDALRHPITTTKQMRRNAQMRANRR